MSLLLNLFQTLLIVLLAPLLAGIIKTAKARLQNRRGPGVSQAYYDLSKLFSKDGVISPTVSWIFYAAPYIYFAAAVAGAVLVPVLFSYGADFSDLFVLIYLFAVGRFFLALASLDAGSAFGGMGGSREMYIAVLVEPALLLALLSVAFRADTTTLSLMAGTVYNASFSSSYVFAALAFFIVVIAETGRIPVDNPDTHLELTMIHEGMVLEYSGRHLGLIFWASAIKQAIMISLFVMLFLPWNLAGIISVPAIILWLVMKIVLVALVIAFIETSTNKMRLFKVPGLLAASCLLSLLALVSQ